MSVVLTDVLSGVGKIRTARARGGGILTFKSRTIHFLCAESDWMLGCVDTSISLFVGAARRGCSDVVFSRGLVVNNLDSARSLSAKEVLRRCIRVSGRQRVHVHRGRVARSLHLVKTPRVCVVERARQRVRRDAGGSRRVENVAYGGRGGGGSDQQEQERPAQRATQTPAETSGALATHRRTFCKTFFSYLFIVSFIVLNCICLKTRVSFSLSKL